MKLLEKDNNNEAIIAYLRDPDADEKQLTKKQKDLLDYYTDAYTVLRNYNSVADAINILIKMSEKRGDKISKSTARRYVYTSMDIFGNASPIKEEGIRHYASNVIMDAIAMARELKDPRTMIVGAKELTATNKVEDTGFNFALLEPHIIEVIMDPEALKLIKMILGKGTVDIDSMNAQLMSEAEDVDYEDSTDQPS